MFAHTHCLHSVPACRGLEIARPVRQQCSGAQTVCHASRVSDVALLERPDMKRKQGPRHGPRVIETGLHSGLKQSRAIFPSTIRYCLILSHPYQSLLSNSVPASPSGPRYVSNDICMSYLYFNRRVLTDFSGPVCSLRVADFIPYHLVPCRLC